MAAKIPRFEVLSLSISKDTGSLKALASVSLAGLITLHGLRVVKHPGQPAVVLLPQTSWVDESGRRRYATLVDFEEKSWRAECAAEVLTALSHHPEGIRSIEPIRPTAFREEVRRRAGLQGQRA